MSTFFLTMGQNLDLTADVRSEIKYCRSLSSSLDCPLKIVMTFIVINKELINQLRFSKHNIERMRQIREIF